MNQFTKANIMRTDTECERLKIDETTYNDEVIKETSMKTHLRANETNHKPKATIRLMKITWLKSVMGIEEKQHADKEKTAEEAWTEFDPETDLQISYKELLQGIT